MSAYLLAFTVTLAVEVPVYVLGLVGLRLAGWRRAVLLAVGVNLATHPVLWWSLLPHPTVGGLLVAEAVVCVAEAGLLWLALRRDAWPLLVLSVAANSLSVLTGLVAGG